MFTLDDYVTGGIMTAATLRKAVAARANILVAGGTSTSKATHSQIAKRLSEQGTLALVHDQ